MGQSCIVLSCVVFSTLVGVSALPALAAGPVPVPPRPAGKAEQQGAPLAALLQRAERARRAGRWAEAAEAYRAAWELDPRPSLAGELGAAEVAIGEHSSGAAHLDHSLEEPDLLTEDQRRRFEEALARAALELATVAISANPPTAEIWIDDRSLGPPRGAYVVFLDPGRYTFRARLDGYEEAEVTLDAQRGSAPRVALPLRERRAAPSPVPTSPPPSPCRAGIRCGGSVASTLRVVGFAATGAALMVGSGMAIGAHAINAELDERLVGRPPYECWGKGRLSPCRGLTELRKTRDLVAGGASLAFLSAGVIGAATVSSFWWAPGGQGAARVQVAPAVAAGHVGAIVHARW